MKKESIIKFMDKWGGTLLIGGAIFFSIVTLIVGLIKQDAVNSSDGIWIMLAFSFYVLILLCMPATSTCKHKNWKAKEFWTEE